MRCPSIAFAAAFVVLVARPTGPEAHAHTRSPRFGMGLRVIGGTTSSAELTEVRTETRSKLRGTAKTFGIRECYLVLAPVPSVAVELGAGYNSWQQTSTVPLARGPVQTLVHSNIAVPLAIGVFWTPRENRPVRLRIGGRLRLDLRRESEDFLSFRDGWEKRNRTMTAWVIALEPAMGLEYFVTDHLSVGPEVFLNVEFAHEWANDDTRTVFTGVFLNFTFFI